MTDAESLRRPAGNSFGDPTCLEIRVHHRDVQEKELSNFPAILRCTFCVGRWSDISPAAPSAAAIASRITMTRLQCNANLSTFMGKSKTASTERCVTLSASRRVGGSLLYHALRRLLHAGRAELTFALGPGKQLISALAVSAMGQHWAQSADSRGVAIRSVSTPMPGRSESSARI